MLNNILIVLGVMCSVGSKLTLVIKIVLLASNLQIMPQGGKNLINIALSESSSLI